jgi:hypothetical protein
VTLTEGTLGPDWTQTSPGNGACTLTGNTVNTNDTCSVSGANPATGVPAFGGVITLTVSKGDDVNAPNFGNFNPNCTSGCTGQQLLVTKTANPIITYTWKIQKAVDNTTIDTSASATANYTVTVNHDNGTATMTGTIKISNPFGPDLSGITVTDAVSDAATDGGNCTVTTPAAATAADGTITVLAGTHVNATYSCTFTQIPAAGSNTNTATATWPAGSASGTASFDFSAATIVDNTVAVTDSLAGSLGSVTIAGDGSTSCTTASSGFSGTNLACSVSSGVATFTYSLIFKDPAGTCTTHNNTAQFTANSTGTTASDSKSVKVCVGADLTVAKTANPSFTRTYNWGISKSATPTLIEKLGGGTATVSYTVIANETGFTDSNFALTGSITVSNPNDWEAITTTVTEIAGCSVTNGGNVSVPASSSVTLSYSCAFGSGASGTNTATATWNAATFFTPDGTATGSKPFAFTTPTNLVNATVTPTDAFNGGAGVNLCTLASGTPCTLTATDSTPFTTQTYTYTRTVAVPTTNCTTYPNTATVVLPTNPPANPTASASVEACGPAGTGALTMGFWQNKNGQGIISGGASTSGVCNSGAWLRQFAPFQDLSATATCSQVATYVFSVIKAATCSGTTQPCNAMLKAQMLATALDVYFGGGPGGNPIGAPVVIGNVKIDLTNICKMIDGSGGTATCSGAFENCSSAFGSATCLTVSQMLAFAASQSNVGGSVWYGNVKATQVTAKDAFDAVNNRVAFPCP